MKTATLLGAVLLAAASASATSITVSYTAYVNNSDVPGIDVGSPMTGSFTYNTADPVVENRFIRLLSPGDELRASAGGYTFLVSAGPGLSAGVYKNFYNEDGNAFLFWADAELGGGKFLTNYAGLDFVYSNAQIIGNSNFVNSEMPANGFEASDVILGPRLIPTCFWIGLRDANQTYSFFGLITSIRAQETPDAVPEPGTWSLLMLGALGMGARSIKAKLRL